MVIQGWGGEKSFTLLVVAHRWLRCPWVGWVGGGECGLPVSLGHAKKRTSMCRLAGDIHVARMIPH